MPVATAGTGSDDNFFICSSCGIARPTQQLEATTGHCIYCGQTHDDRDLDDEQQVCHRCGQTWPRLNFLDPGGNEPPQCNDCNVMIQESQYSDPPTTIRPSTPSSLSMSGLAIRPMQAPRAPARLPQGLFDLTETDDRIYPSPPDDIVF